MAWGSFDKVLAIFSVWQSTFAVFLVINAATQTLFSSFGMPTLAFLDVR